MTSDYSKNYVLQLKETNENSNDQMSNFYNIWEGSPSFQDINTKLIYGKLCFVFGFAIFFLISIYFKTLNVILSLAVAVFFILAIIVVFQEEFFSLNDFISNRSSNLSQFDPFKDIKFWQANELPDTLFYTNTRDSVSVALRIYRIKVVPSNVEPNIRHLLKSFNSKRISFTYQIVHAPISKDIGIGGKKYRKTASIGSIMTSIYFCFYYDFKGVINRSKLRNLVKKLDEYSAHAKNAFNSNFHHFKIRKLKNESLINAVRTIFVKSEVPLEVSTDVLEMSKMIKILGKIIICTINFLFILFSASNYGFSFLISFIIGVIGTMILIILFWKSLFFRLSSSLMSKFNGIQMIDPFNEVIFYRNKGIQGEMEDNIFALINNSLLINFKSFNVFQIIPSELDGRGKFLASPENMFQAIVPQQIPFIYTCNITPMSFKSFEDEAFNYLTNKSQKHLLWSSSEMQQEKYLQMRKGLWRTFYSFTISSYMQVKRINNEILNSLVQELEQKSMAFKSAFEMNLLNYKLLSLNGNRLTSSLLLLFLKNKFFRLNGCRLNYLIRQGEILLNTINIFPQLMKGIKNKIASEFNTPLHLKNFISIGHAINTEVLEKETKAGFTRDQLMNVLITNGSIELQELMMMKMVVESIKANLPSIIFDFTGNWSKLLTLFKDSRYDEDVLHFKLGKSFTIDITKSDIPYDLKNLTYLDFVAECYALSFKKNDLFTSLFKKGLNEIGENQSFSDYALGIENEPEWDKNPNRGALASIFGDFNQNDIAFFNKGSSDKITMIDFLANDNTIILDLSEIKDAEKKIFTTFILISKMLHFMESEEEIEYIKKIIYIPQADIFFNEIYLRSKMKYDKIDQFMKPLREFGTVFSLTAINSIHPHLLTYFDNFIAFKTTDKRDIAQLANIMNFRKLHSGIYSNSRKETYQIDYLTSLNKREGIIKRDDIDDPFPVKLDIKVLDKILPMEYGEIVKIMKNLGYDLKYREKRILQEARTTIFAKDFGVYSSYQEEIIKFLNSLKSIDAVGNLYKNVIKEDLKNYIYPKARIHSKSKKNKQKITKIRDDILEIMIKQGYLIENHRKTASGAQTIRTSYSVGPQFENALNDYFSTKKEAPINISPEIISNESNIMENAFVELSQERKPDDKLKNTILKEISTISTSLWSIYRLVVKENDPITAQKVIKNTFPSFLNRLYSSYHDTEGEVSEKSIIEFIQMISNASGFPLSHDELTGCYHASRNIEIDEGEIGTRVKKLYERLMNIHDGLNDYIIK